MKIILFFLLSIVIPTSVWSGWPFEFAPTIKGKITDAVTGEPIENVVVRRTGVIVEFWKIPLLEANYKSADIPFVLDQDYLMVTGKDGKYCIPGGWVYRYLIGMSYGGIGIDFQHPLYLYEWREWRENRLGTIHCDVGLRKPRDIEIEINSFSGARKGGFWHKIYKKTGVTYNWDNILKEWKERAASERAKWHPDMMDMMFAEAKKIEQEIDFLYPKKGGKNK